MRTNVRAFAAAEIVPDLDLAPLDLAAIFGRRAPLEVDLGCGDGSFLVALAAQNPARDFLGVERLPGRFRGATRKIGDQQVANARVLRADIVEAVQHLLPRGAVDTFHLMFPDPWPKRRHQSRRVFSANFLRAVAGGLRDGGVLRVVTDDDEYFADMRRISAASKELTEEAVNPAADFPPSTFEARFRHRGIGIHRLSLRKVSEPR